MVGSGVVILKIGKNILIQFSKEDRNSYGLRGLPSGIPFFHKYSNYAGQEKRKTETLQY